MEISALFSIDPSSVAIEVSTSLDGVTDIEVCSGSTFNEMFCKLASTNYGIADVLGFLKQQPEWEEIEERIKSEETASAEQQKNEEADRKEREKLRLEGPVRFFVFEVGFLLLFWFGALKARKRPQVPPKPRGYGGA
jgi:hypothetical protein